MSSAHDLLTRWPSLAVAEKQARLQGSLHLTPGPLAGTLTTAADTAARAAAGLWKHDPSAWTADPAVQKLIGDRLGWMTSPALMADSIDRLETFAANVKRDGFTDVVLLGMGGSSLAPEVLRAVIGVATGFPRFHMLDSTDPAAVRATTAAIAPTTSLFLLASKSGGTIEPNVLAAHFRHVLETSGVSSWANHFVAITDPGTAVERRARDEKFRDVFLNPPDIGGRYSALSFFGMVPAALMGQDLGELIGWGLAMLAAAEPGAAGPMDNPAVSLGLAMGVAARDGIDKLTLLAPASLDAFGLWVEQLIAESTGKKGTGIVPICNESPAGVDKYGTDRLFVRARLYGAADEDRRDTLERALTAAHAPLAGIDVPEPAALGAEFVRWEIATAVAGAVLQIDPFDQPNVQQAKDATQALLAQYKASHALPIPPPDRTLSNGITLTLSAAAKKSLQPANSDAFLSLIHQGDYFALLAYVSTMDRGLADELNAMRTAVRDKTRAATMFGFGPRYLHSTGQLHKGGANSGVFLLITATPREDLPIPGEQFSFGTLELAQAVGDFASLDAAGRRALHAHLPAPDRALLKELAQALVSRSG
jgi:transaldolase / glucose-6-phosphate isomerase